jgi:hypothetical protein
LTKNNQINPNNFGLGEEEEKSFIIDRERQKETRST